MMTVIVTIAMIWIFGKLLIFGIKAAWGLSKILLWLVCLPLLLVVLIVAGLFYLAIPILAIVGILSFVDGI